MFIAYLRKSKHGFWFSLTLSILTLGSMQSMKPVIADEYATAEELELMQGFPPPVDKRVDRSNALFTSPYNRWSYQNMRSIYPTAGIRNAEVAVPVKTEIDAGIEHLKVINPDTGKPVDMEIYFKETYTDAFVVIKGDTIVFEEFLNGMTADQEHQMMSVTKSFAGLFGLMAAAEGKLNEDDLVVKYVPELEQSGAFANATVGQVLDMTNSLDFSEDYADPTSGIVQYAKVLGFIEATDDESLADNIYDYLASLPKDFDHEHGDIFHYQTPKTDVVNWVTNRATGRSFQQDLYDKLWSKLGTDGSTYVLLDKSGTLFAGGGLNATPKDLARFAIMMLNQGEFNGQQVVPAAVVRELAEGGSIEAFSNGTESKGVMGNKDWSYRAQWWVRHTPGHEAFMAIGVNGQWIYIDPTRNIAIIKQSSQPVSSDNFYDEYNINAFDAVITYLNHGQE
ncbi:6-aminohexanoate-dimer hydrolase [Pseudovibrio japonicus]|uniref:6-aminohexanoate-dimer hydrolase n=1 Tax=Pseudovibrio japonicus TaxID=366534 RepID=A0ABQ3E2I5_9HYPH|nr:serine hydrolase [Pseudovibrio japonicus]GHB21646.1 6-aminohexanoate-dimer hydrolase [Pseudovibrio japonicus]